MIIILLPTTNIYFSKYIENQQYNYNNENIYKIEPITQSINYYLNKIILKTNNIDYSYFINIYNNYSKIKALTNSFFIFIEIIKYFNLNKYSNNILYYVNKNSLFDWGIIQAFYHINSFNNFYINNNIEIPNELKNIICNNNKLTQDIIILDKFCLKTIKSQKINSNLILKINNLFDEYSIKSLYYLCSVYNKVFITKPISSWDGSSIKYVVCKYFKGSKYNLNNITILKPTNLFLTKISEINCIYVELQIKSLLSIYDKPIDTLINSNQQKCINWFIKHDIDYIDDNDIKIIEN